MNSKKRFASKNRDTLLPDKYAKVINDAVSIIIIAVCMMIILSLFSYDKNDPSWLKETDSIMVHNYLGVFGSYLSNILLSIFGYTSWIIPALLLQIAYSKFHRTELNFGGWYSLVKLVCGVLLITALSSFDYMFFISHVTLFHGGIVGAFVYAGLMNSFGISGAFIIILTVFLIVSSLYFTLSWVSFCEYVGGVVINLCQSIFARSQVVFNERKNKKTKLLSASKTTQQMDLNNNLFSENELFAEKKDPVMDSTSALDIGLFQHVVPVETPTSDSTINSISLAKQLEEMNYNIISDVDKSITTEAPQDNLQPTVLPESETVIHNIVETTVVPDSIAVLDNTIEEKAVITSSYEHTNTIDAVQQTEASESVITTIAEDTAVAKPIIPLRVKQVKIKDNLLQQDLLSTDSDGMLPGVNLLDRSIAEQTKVTPEMISLVSNTLVDTLAEFNIATMIDNVESGPVVTRYEFVPPKGVRGEKISTLSKELARSLALTSIRVVENIPGKVSMGIEVPNYKRQMIYLRDVFSSDEYRQSNSLLTLALGKDVSGQVVTTDLSKMPHLLVAGTTGSGKSVAVNTMILSILYKATPQQVKFIMIDPKMVELSFYQDIPHLLAPVVTDMTQAANALRWVVGEMETRYRIMSKSGTKNIIGFNDKIKAMQKAGTPIYHPFLDDVELNEWEYIVVIIDELADLMMVAGKKIEQYIARIAQKARAVGIHLIVATQRPSVDVITGLIKANVPARISFQVASKIDSRTILDQGGGEALLGQGDMLFLNPGSGIPRRVHGAYVNDDELHRVVEYLKTTGKPSYENNILTGEISMELPGLEDDNSTSSANTNDALEKDPLYDQALSFLISSKRCSISALQTQFGIGYNKAARFMAYFEKVGVVRRTERGTFELLLKDN